MTDWALEDDFSGLSSFDYIKKKSGTTGWSHSRGEQEKLKYIKMMLESLVDSGDLERDDIEYKVTPKAYATIADYELDERRHRTTVNTQIILAVLTAGLIIVGLIQIWVSSGF